jgi:hypothetical protein
MSRVAQTMMELILETFRRCRPDLPPASLRNQALLDVSYELAAPDDILAGSVVWDQVDRDWGFPVPTFREGE